MGTVTELHPTIGRDEVLSHLRHPAGKVPGEDRTFEVMVKKGESAWLPGSPTRVYGPAWVRYNLAGGEVTYKVSVG